MVFDAGAVLSDIKCNLKNVQPTLDLASYVIMWNSLEILTPKGDIDITLIQYDMTPLSESAYRDCAIAFSKINVMNGTSIIFFVYGGMK